MYVDCSTAQMQRHTHSTRQLRVVKKLLIKGAWHLSHLQVFMPLETG